LLELQLAASAIPNTRVAQTPSSASPSGASSRLGVIGGTLSSDQAAESQPRDEESGVDEHELQHRLMELERYDSESDQSLDPLINTVDT
jgi:hypothetical protein